MSQLTANIVYATYATLDEVEKEAFMQLIEEDEPKRKKKKIPNKYRGIEEKYLPGNERMLAAEIKAEILNNR
jgi:hypothetical protein